MTRAVTPDPGELEHSIEDMVRPGMRVLFVITGLGLGGAQVQLAHICRALLMQGVQVRVITLIPVEEFGALRLPKEVAILSLGMHRGQPSISAIWRLRRHALDWQPQVVVAFMFHSIILCRAALVGLRRIRKISTFRTTAFGHWWAVPLLRATRMLDDMHVTNSKFAGAVLEKAGVTARNRWCTIPNGVGAPSHVGASKGTGDGLLRLVSVGRLETQKDYPTLLHALQHLKRWGIRFEQVIVGDGEEKPRLVALADRLGLRDNVKFAGPHLNAAALLASFECLVLSSRWEGMPNVVLEAMAAGIPVVATNVGGVQELVVPERSGYIVPTADPVELAHALRRIAMLTPDQRREMGEYGRSVALQDFSLDVLSKRWLSLILTDVAYD